jgi:microcystin-dependent protein
MPVLDNAGTILAGGSITTYLAGTTTLASTYTDIDLASPSHLNANPVVLSAAAAATVFVPRGTSYKFLIKDSAGVTVRTIDQILVYDDTYSHTANVEVPIGALLPYCGTVAPTKFLLCNGAAVSRTTYAELFGVCAELWGAGDSTTTFNLPDMRGKFPFGTATAGTGSTLGGSFGTIDHVHTGPSHTHTTTGATASDGAVAVTGSVAAGGTGAVTGSTASGTADIAGTDVTNVATTGGATAAGNDTHDNGHDHAAGTLAGPSHQHTATGLTGGAHTHASGTLSAVAAGTGNTGTANAPGCAFNWIVRAL